MLRIWWNRDFVNAWFVAACWGFDKNPSFRTYDDLLTIFSSKFSCNLPKLLTLCFLANTIRTILSWFNFSIFVHIQVLISPKQASIRSDISSQLSDCLMIGKFAFHPNSSGMNCHASYRYHLPDTKTWNKVLVPARNMRGK